MIIRRAREIDLPFLNKLLIQVCSVHSEKRADLFKKGAKKYTDSELIGLLSNENKPIFVAEKDGEVVGYCFCEIQPRGGNIFYDKTTLYIDDLCVDENCRRQGIGEKLYRHAAEFAKSVGCYDITLNVWSLNQKAIAFYQKLGLKPLKVYMEEIL